MKSRNASGGPAWLLRAEHPTAGTRGKVAAVRVHSCGSLGLWYRGEHGLFPQDSPKQYPK